MKLIEVKAYEYSELSQEAREKAKKFILGVFHDTYAFTDQLKDDLKYRFGIEDLRPYYSLSYCQGDGLCLKGEIRAYEFLNNKVLRSMAYKGLKTYQRKMADEIIAFVDFKGGYWHYCYHKKEDVEIESTYDFLSEAQEKVINLVLDNVRKWYVELCTEYEKWGYEFFYEISDEEAEEDCRANKWFFHEDGSFFRMSA